MTYDPNAYVVKNSVLEDEVIEVKDGPVSGFVKDFKKFNKNNNDKMRPDSPAIQVRTGLGIEFLIVLLEGKEVSPVSNMGKWILSFGGAPFVGQKIKAKISKTGFYTPNFTTDSKDSKL